MNGELKPISVQDMVNLLTLPKEHLNVMVEWAKKSDPLLAGMWGEDLVCLVGFIPPTMLSDTAYVWMHSTDLALEHPIALGRFARRFIKAALERYPRLVGDCLNETSKRWLESLGAKFTGTWFVIEAV